jgi:thymidylate synthase (FAD)
MSETKRPVSEAAEQILGKYFRILDHGFVALLDYCGNDLSICQAARVSYGAGTKGTADDRALLRYMLKHGHTSPFEQVILKFHVKLPVFVARQLIRHRTASINEYSMRYSLPVMQFYMPTPNDMGTQSKKNKQGRAEPVSAEQAAIIQNKWKEMQVSAVEFYEYLTSQEVDMAREIARIGLPLSIYTEWYWTIDLHNLLHFMGLRSDSHAQWEIQQFSNVKAAMVKRVAPIAYEAWIDYKFQSHTFSRMEMVMLRKVLSTTGNKIWSFQNAEIDLEESIKNGLSNREWEEFKSLFDREADPNLFEKPIDFDLNPADGVSGDVLLAEAQQFIPRSL